MPSRKHQVKASLVWTGPSLCRLYQREANQAVVLWSNVCLGSPNFSQILVNANTMNYIKDAMQG